MDAITVAILLFSAIAIEILVYSKMYFKKMSYNCEFNVHTAKVGDEVELIETVVNRKRLPIPWLRVSIFSSRWLEYAGDLSSVVDETRYVSSVFYTGGNQKVKRTWPITCTKRGIFDLSNVTLIGGDPLGFTTLSTGVDATASIMVYPIPIDVEESLVPLSLMLGETIVNRWIIDDPFLIAGVRDYTPSDTMNRIHMGATAKTGRLMVKKCDFTSSVTMTIILNMQSIERELDRIVDKNSIEVGIRIAAGFFDMACNMGIPFRFLSNGKIRGEHSRYAYSELNAGPSQQEMLLVTLAKLEMFYDVHFDKFCSEALSDLADSECIMITSFVDDAIADSIRELKAQKNSVKLVILDYAADTSKVPEGISVYLYKKQGTKEGVG